MAEYMDIYSGQIFETDYIPREAVRCEMYHNQGPLTEYQLNSIPAVDVRTVGRGKWHNWYHMLMPDCYVATCSNCGKAHRYLGMGLLNYCPNCGADMRK